MLQRVRAGLAAGCTAAKGPCVNRAQSAFELSAVSKRPFTCKLQRCCSLHVNHVKVVAGQYTTSECAVFHSSFADARIIMSIQTDVLAKA